MGRVKELAVERVEKTAIACGKDEREAMQRWNENLRRPEGMLSLEEFLYNMTKK